MSSDWHFDTQPIAGTRIESWTRNRQPGGSAWVCVKGTVTYANDGEPMFATADVEGVTFHDSPPIKTNYEALWRYT